ncbi:SPW repeat protein [Streptomyces flavidovirens]|uniref:SPW repeat domain-containing protein n=1 Tax=Streptomyces flavidovirens TaxID=67298 RepID=UPI00341BBB7A
MDTTSSGAAPQPATKRALRQGQRDQIITFLMLVVAIALFFAPWVVGTPDSAKDIHRSELGVGMVVLVVAMARFKWHLGKGSDLIILAAGAWLIASPWALSLQNTVVFDGAHVLDVAAGIILIVLATTSLLLLRSASKAEDRQQ